MKQFEQIPSITELFGTPIYPIVPAVNPIKIKTEKKYLLPLLIALGVTGVGILVYLNWQRKDLLQRMSRLEAILGSMTSQDREPGEVT